MSVTSNRYQVSIEADSTLPIIRMTRDFDATPAELMEAMFTDGISTAPFVSELSGRGVGMGALRSETLSRGGDMKVTATSGSGTRVEFSFPLGAMTNATPEHGVAAE